MHAKRAHHPLETASLVRVCCCLFPRLPSIFPPLFFSRSRALVRAAASLCLARTATSATTPPLQSLSILSPSPRAITEYSEKRLGAIRRDNCPLISRSCRDLYIYIYIRIRAGTIIIMLFLVAVVLSDFFSFSRAARA